MKETLLTRADEYVGEGTFDSIAWALEQHVKVPDTGEYQTAILYGREDAPDMIDFYTQTPLLITDKRAFRWVSE